MGRIRVVAAGKVAALVPRIDDVELERSSSLEPKPANARLDRVAARSRRDRSPRRPIATQQLARAIGEQSPYFAAHAFDARDRHRVVGGGRVPEPGDDRGLSRGVRSGCVWCARRFRCRPAPRARRSLGPSAGRSSACSVENPRKRATACSKSSSYCACSTARFCDRSRVCARTTDRCARSPARGGCARSWPPAPTRRARTVCGRASPARSSWVRPSSRGR